MCYQKVYDELKKQHTDATVNLDHNFYKLLKYAKESILQQPTDKAVLGNFYPHPKIIPKYTVHGDTFNLQLQQEVSTVIFQDNWDEWKKHPPETASNFYSVTDITEINQCPPDPAGITAVNRQEPMIKLFESKLLQQCGMEDTK